MKRSAFASLCSVSKQQVSKYEGQGLVVVNGDQVDAVESLGRLEGRLDEGKRLKALQLLDRPDGNVRASPTGGGPGTPPNQGTGGRSAKIERDEIERDLRRLDYGQKAGELVHVSDVAEQATLAISVMRESFANAKRDIAADLCALFDIPSDKVTAVARFLGEKFELPLGRFAAIAGALAKEPGSADHHIAQASHEAHDGEHANL